MILSRSGTSGVQRFGALMWSGDTASNLASLAAHLNAQMHMSFSGIDYFGSDIGGFHRGGLDGDIDELYTIWFANAMAFDVPGRPHVSNTENKYETAPDRIGHQASNLANLRQRYELIPYYYTLAHRAWRYGEPVVPPLVFYFQDDPNVREMGDEKLIGRDLLVASVTRYGDAARDVYLPAGRWVNWHTDESSAGAGRWVRRLPLWRDGRFVLPMFARAGAIIPMMQIDDQSMNAMGLRRDGGRRDALRLRVIADPWESAFTVFEDDGVSIAYQHGAVRETRISQVLEADGATVTIEPAVGDYAGAVPRRENVVELVLPGPIDELSYVKQVSVTWNDQPLAFRPDAAKLDAAPDGWTTHGDRRIVAKTPEVDVGERKVLRVSFNGVP
jgi:alpha-glucosidase